MKLLPVAPVAVAIAFSALSGPAVRAQAGSDCHDVAALERRLRTMVATVARRGGSLLVVHENVEVARLHAGGFSASTVVPIASATKWLSGAVIMKLVDQGRLSLDDTIGKYRRDFAGKAAGITIRQMFSHTSGLVADHPAIGNLSLTMEQAVAQIARAPLAHDPGTAFTYGGASMHVAARIAEQVTGKDFETLLKELIGAPLGMRSTDYQGLGATRNYRVAGGARSSLEDYGRLLEMLANDGMFRGKRVLSKRAVDAMFADQTRGARIVKTPQRDSRRYGIGCWRDRVDSAGAALEVSSPGAFGAWGWVDRERNGYGMLLVQSLLPFTLNQTEALLQEIRRQVRYAGVACYGRSTPACRGTVRLASDRPARAGDAAFRLTGAGAPPTTAGVLLLGGRAVTRPVRLLGVDLWLVPDAVALGLPVASDFAGALFLPVSLRGVAPGGPIYAQVVWRNTLLCGGLGRLSASHALAVTVR